MVRKVVAVAFQRATVEEVQQVVVVVHAVVPLLHQLQPAPPVGPHQMNQYRPPGWLDTSQSE